MSPQVKALSTAIVCKGISVRTTNNAEISHDSAKLGRLWQKFYQNHVSHLGENEDIYGVFHNYESEDLVGAFDVVASWQVADKSSDNERMGYQGDTVEVTIPAGKYLVFSEKGNMPNTVMNAWEKAWEYFNDPDCEHSRTYDVDFEHYIDGNLEYGQVDLYVGIQ